MPVVVEDVRRVALTLPRAYEVLVRDRIKFRVKSLVFVAFSRDESLMGFGFPKEERELLVESRPDTFQLPSPSNMRYQWVVAKMAALDLEEMPELIIDAWQMVVPKGVAKDFLERQAWGQP
ncbi:MAG: hypothetical protein QOJ72_1423 [Nocardioidaceae bacterium]|jgi:hypothetical protein|nr:hypothetical protein [Nocardioidaceae bacterium]